MKMKKQTPPIWDFLDDAFKTRDALKAGTLEDLLENNERIRVFSEEWLHLGTWDNLEQLEEHLDILIVDSLTEGEMRRMIAGIFYRRVEDQIAAGFECGDAVDEPIFKAYSAAIKANEMIDANIELTGTGDWTKDETRLAYQRHSRSCDRYVTLANMAYERACAFADTFGFENHMELYVEKGEPCDACKAQFDQLNNVIPFVKAA